MKSPNVGTATTGVGDQNEILCRKGAISAKGNSAGNGRRAAHEKIVRAKRDKNMPRTDAIRTG